MNQINSSSFAKPSSNSLQTENTSPSNQPTTRNLEQLATNLSHVQSTSFVSNPSLIERKISAKPPQLKLVIPAFDLNLIDQASNQQCYARLQPNLNNTSNPFNFPSSSHTSSNRDDNDEPIAKRKKCE